MTKLPNAYEPLLLTFHLPREENGYVVIGDDEGCDLCLMPDGVISTVDVRGTLPSRFVNSSIEQLSQCIQAHRDYARNVTECNDEDRQLEVVEHFARSLGRIDPKGVCDAENWWSVIVEQMRDGLL